jgi:hypothetical protein
MIGRIVWLPLLVLALAVAACGGMDDPRTRLGNTRRGLSPEQSEAETRGREIFDLVDRAMDYR